MAQRNETCPKTNWTRKWNNISNWLVLHEVFITKQSRNGILCRKLFWSIVRKKIFKWSKKTSANFWRLRVCRSCELLISVIKKKIYIFCFLPMKASQSLMVSKDGSFWSSQTWQRFLTHAKHFAPECKNYYSSLKW